MESHKQIQDQIIYSEGGVTSKVVFKGNNSQITLFCMAEGTDISEHTSTKEGFVYVIEGDGVFCLGGEDILMKKGILIHMEKSAKHSVQAKTNLSFLLFLTE